MLFQQGLKKDLLYLKYKRWRGNRKQGEREEYCSDMELISHTLHHDPHTAEDSCTCASFDSLARQQRHE